MTRSYSSSSEDPWSTDSDSDSTYSERSPNFSKHRNSAGRHNDYTDRPPPPRHRGRHGKTGRKRHGRKASCTGPSNSRSSTLVKAAITLVGKVIFNFARQRLEQRRQSGGRRIYTASDRFKDMHSSPSSPSKPTRDRSPHPRSKTPPSAPTIPTITSLQNVSTTLHRSLRSLCSKADVLHHNLSASSHQPDRPPNALKLEGAELLAHCNSLRERAEEFVEDVEVLLTKDDKGRRRGSVSKGLRELWRDADGLREKVDGFVEEQRRRLGREVFY